MWNNCIAGNNIHQGFSDHCRCNAAHIYTVNVVPESLFLLLVVAIFNSCHVHVNFVRKHLSTFDEILVASPDNVIQHRLVKKEVSHPLRDYNVYLAHWKGNFFHLALNYSNFICKTISLNNFPSVKSDFCIINSVNMLCTGTSSKDWQDSSTTANIENNFIFKILGIFLNSSLVGSCADGIL